MTGRVVAVNLAHVIETPAARQPGRLDKKPRRTGIDKRPAEGPVEIGPLGLVGDSILDTVHHGGTLQAAYAYAVEDLAWWQEELDRPLAPGNFGENLTTEGVDVNGARAGDRWSVGEVVLEVTSPRTPCSTFAAFLDVPQWVRRFASAERPGAYLRVVTPGAVSADDAIEVATATTEGPTIRDVFASHYRR